LINIKSHWEIELLREANIIDAEVLQILKEHCIPGITTKELDRIAEEEIRKRGAVPGFKGYFDYPATLCASVNDVIIHGIPDNTKLKEGDIISLDLGTIYKGYYGDAAITVAVGKISDEARKLMDITEEALYRGIDAALPGNRVGDISYAVQSFVESKGFSVIREFTGHGIGRELHEQPAIPNFGEKGTGIILKEGMTIAIEPMISAGRWKTKTMQDGWTVKTIDGSLAAHFEHTILIKNGGAEILSIS